MLCTAQALTVAVHIRSTSVQLVHAKIKNKTLHTEKNNENFGAVEQQLYLGPANASPSTVSWASDKTTMYEQGNKGIVGRRHQPSLCPLQDECLS